MNGSPNDTESRKDELRFATVLMVDDEETTLDVLEAFLNSEGYENLVSCTDSRQAIGLVRTREPDLVLLDLQMPHVSGLDILRAMQSDTTLRRIPVLILTSATDAATKLQALELGATDFLSKPVDPSELALRLRNTLSAKAYQDRLARYDGLTGLPNRGFFQQRVGNTLERLAVQGAGGAVLHLDIDRFQQLNDALGHRAGDKVLRSVAERLESCIRPGDIVGLNNKLGGGEPPSRVGGDEFSLFVPGVTSAEVAARLARRVGQSIARPIEVEGQSIVVSVSLGIALYPDDGDDAGSLLQRAEGAMTRAKRSGGNCFSFHSGSHNTESRERLRLESMLRAALARRELVLHYQPKLEVATGRIVGCEALMRWDHPEIGMIPPGRFIPIAEQCGLIPSIGEWAIFEVCRQLAAWREVGLGEIRASVNVSSLQFREHLPKTFSDALQISGLDGSALVVEVTESVIMENTAGIARLFERLKELGLEISLDDFGTRYSSLTNLRVFPVDELKIDYSFLKGTPDDAGDNAIVSAIIAMGHNLSMRVVAEGVEQQAQLDFIGERGCDEYQGFLCSPALPANQFAHLVARQRQRA